MSVKNLQTVTWTIDEANQRLRRTLSVEYWAFVIAQVNYREVTFDNAAKQIVFAEYIPIQGLIEEVLTRIASGAIAVARCLVCQQYFDMNKVEGIFGDTNNLERFVCQACARRLSAWDFYHQYLKVN